MTAEVLFFMVLLVGGPVLFVVAAGVLLVQAVVVVRRIHHRRRPFLSWGASAVALGCVAILAEVHGFYAGAFFYKDPEDICPEPPQRIAGESLVPLHHSCLRADGGTTDLVPAFVNPTVAVCLAGMIGCAVLAARGWRRDRTGGPGSAGRAPVAGRPGRG